MSAPLLFCTVATADRLAHARTLERSLRRHHPGARLRVLLAGARAGEEPAASGLELVELDRLGLPGVERLAFRYTAQQFCGMVKPWLLRASRRERPDARWVYLDATGWVGGSLAGVAARLRRAPILLTPHLIAPLPDDGRHKDDLDILLSGPYNSGFVAVAPGRAAGRFLDWWGDRVLRHCMPEGGAWSNDQKWLALVPSLFPGTALLRDPGCNLAYWNMGDRFLSGPAGRLRVNGRPLRFAFFSGYDPDRPGRPTRYPQDRIAFSTRPDLRRFFDDYRRALLANGYGAAKRRPYAFAAFDNGAPVPEAARVLYRKLGDAERFGDPFAARPRGSFFRWLNAAGRSGVSRFWREVYLASGPLRRALPEALGRDRPTYVRWIETQGWRELGAPLDHFPARGAG